MKLLPEKLLAPLRSGDAVRSSLRRAWASYAAPCPRGRELALQLCLCACVSALSGGLLHRWLRASLLYGESAAAAASCACGAGLLLLSALSHPLRCVLTLALPSAGSRQGRRLLLSAAAALTLLRVLPNLWANVGAAARLLRCGAEAASRALLNSTRPLREAERELLRELRRARSEDLSLLSTLRSLEQVTSFDLSAVRGRLGQVVGQVEVYFTQARGLLSDYKLLSNRVLAAVFVALLVLEAARYLRAYLASVGFDAPRDSAASGCRMSRREGVSCFLSVAVVTLYFVAISALVVLDQLVYNAVELVGPWMLDFPSTSASITLDYKLLWFAPASCLSPFSCSTQELTSFHRDYRWTFNPDASPCAAATSAPSRGVRLLLGGLWVASYAMVFLEVFAQRLRRKICASFFRQQEERRREHAARKLRGGGAAEGAAGAGPEEGVRLTSPRSHQLKPLPSTELV